MPFNMGKYATELRIFQTEIDEKNSKIAKIVKFYSNTYKKNVIILAQFQNGQAIFLQIKLIVIVGGNNIIFHGKLLRELYFDEKRMSRKVEITGQ